MLSLLAAEFLGPPGNTLTPRHAAGLDSSSRLNAAPAVNTRGTFNKTARGRLTNGSASASTTNEPKSSKTRRVAVRGSSPTCSAQRQAVRPLTRTGAGIESSIWQAPRCLLKGLLSGAPRHEAVGE